MKVKSGLERELRITSHFTEILKAMFEEEKPINVLRLNDPLINEIKRHYKAQGREVFMPYLAEKEKYLAQGCEVARHPEMQKEIWAGSTGGNRFGHILLLKPNK